MGAEFFDVDGRPDRRMTKLTVVLCNFANVPKYGCLAIFYVDRDVPILLLTYNNNNNNYYYYYCLIRCISCVCIYTMLRGIHKRYRTELITKSTLTFVAGRHC